MNSIDGVFKLILFCFIIGGISGKPNILFVLTDDQDYLLNSMSAMQKTLSLVGEKGATFTNAFVATPLCCPSRSGILTGQYVHNHGAINNSLSGGCSSLEWQSGPEKNTFPVLLKEAGYTTFFSGKYLNNYGFESVGGLSHVPPGWSSWVGLKGNSVYYNYSLSVNGTSVYHGDDPNKDYLTNIIKDEGVKFIDGLTGDSPFFMMLSTPSSHSPDTPEPKYMNSLNTSTIPDCPNFNIANKNKNWFVMQGEQPLKQDVVDEIQEIYRNRLRTLLSVDDLVDTVMQKLEERGFLNNTYVFFSSDHGYHLGQFSMPRDKREPYEFDIRVPLLVRGPGISEGVQISEAVTNIDLAPTFLDLAGLKIPQNFDGISFKSTLLGFSKLKANITERSLLIEHSGEGSNSLANDCEYLGTGFAYCLPDLDCKCQDAYNNTYNCVRTLGDVKNEIYCVWQDYDNFEEYYNLTIDPYQLTNSAANLSETERSNLQQKLTSLIQCSGSSCQNIQNKC